MLYDIIASVKNKRILNRKKHVYEKNLLNDSRAVRKYNMEVAVLKKLVTVLGAFFAVLLACPLSVFAAEGSKAPSTSTCMALHSLCRAFVMYCSDASGKSGVVGVSSATGCCLMDHSDGGSICFRLWSRKDCRDSSGLYCE